MECVREEHTRDRRIDRLQHSSGILWCNANSDVFLVDIPQSIAAAQGTQDEPYLGSVESSLPLETPYPSNEPKTPGKRAKLETHTVFDEIHADYQPTLQRALSELTKSYADEHCLPRLLVSNQPYEDPNTMPQFRDRVDHRIAASQVTDHQVRYQSNGSDTSQVFTINASQGSDLQRVRVPPRSTFYLATCNEVSAFHDAVRHQAQNQGTRRKFDFILLDPPWPNRSVRRTHKTPGSSYTAARHLRDLGDMISRMDLDMLMADDCLVAIWITNKAAVRNLVLDEGGLFDRWGVVLEEEWIWLKTTTKGDPMVPLDSLWRKPYEILLISRRRWRHSAPFCEKEHADIKPRRRVLIGVPDKHSRKPCLKELVELIFMKNMEGYRALEIFARHLVAGWWSWGDECTGLEMEDVHRPRAAGETTLLSSTD